MIDYSNSLVKEKLSTLRKIEKIDSEVNKLEQEKRGVDKKIINKNNKKKSLWEKFYRENNLENTQGEVTCNTL